MRSDALRRREALVREARRIFAENGAGVALETVADAAGVGIATLYRNFAQREALLDAVAAAVLEDVCAATQAAIRATEGDGADVWTAWCGWASSVAAVEIGALAAALAGEYGARIAPEVLELQAELVDLLEVLVARVRAEGLAPTSVSGLELLVGIARMTRPQVATGGAMADDLGERLVLIFLAGLRSQAQG